MGHSQNPLPRQVMRGSSIKADTGDKYPESLFLADR